MQIDGETVLRRAVGGEPVSLDPGKAVDTYSFEIIRDLYEGLVTESRRGDVLPAIASSWTISPSGTEYIFELRKEARWSNGERIRAQDFVTSWRRVVDPKVASPVSDLFRPITNAGEISAGKLPIEKLGVIALDQNHLMVRLVQPSPFFLQLLTHSATFPVYRGESPGHDGAKWISNGAYVLSKWKPGAFLTLKKNSEYWDHDNVKIPLVQYLPISDDNAELIRYRNGQLEITQSVPPGAVSLISREFPNELHVAPYLGTVYYAMNVRPNKVLHSSLLRPALAMAIDREVLAKSVLVFGQAPAYGFVPPNTWNYDPQHWPWQSLSHADRLKEARALYAKAGYTPEHPLRLTLLFNSNPEVKKLSIALASIWKEELGVVTELVEEEYRVFLNSRRESSRWDLARLSWVADYNDAANFLDTFRRDSPNNDSGYSNPEFDSLLNEAAVSNDPAARKQLLERAENLMLSEYPLIPVYFYSSKRLIKPFVKGAESNPLNHLYSKHLSIASER